MSAPATLADSLAALASESNSGTPRPTCGVMLAAESLSEADGWALLGAMDNPNIPARALALHLREQAALHGNSALALGISTIHRHRRRSSGSGCKCPVNA
jgi:hypothetical protein